MKKLEMNNINIGNPNISKNKLLQSVRLYNKFTTYVNVNKNVRLKRLYIFRGQYGGKTLVEKYGCFSQ